MSRAPIPILIAALLNLNGCALMSLRDENQESYTGDPVAAAAMKLRQPSSLNSPYRASVDQLESARNHNDIIRGMTRDDVVEIWGTPRKIEPAGDEASGNERWIYSEGLSSRWSLSNTRILYFEQGQLAGWETQYAQ